MRNTKKILIILILTFIIIFGLQLESKAQSDLYLNNLTFDVKLNEDSSMEVIEYWNIDIEDTNTLYKSFEKDNTKYTNISDVKVTDITNGNNKILTQISNWEYHVPGGKFYATDNPDGNFEIGWGVALEDKSERKEYKIEYKVENAIKKYNDYAELYWQFIGNGFEISIQNIKGTIILPQKATSKEQIKVWGHTENLNGTIYATDLNKIEFELTGYTRGKMVEIRTLFPTEMIIIADRTENKDILQQVVDEETKWANEANQRRLAKIMMITGIIVVAGIILDIVYINEIRRCNKNTYKNEKKFVPDQSLEYFREIPDESATPGEAVKLINKNISKLVGSLELGRIFSAGLLNLKLKGYIDLEIDESKKKKDQINIEFTNNTNVQPLFKEEKTIYKFLNQVILDKEDKTISLSNLQKYIKKYPERTQKLQDEVGKNIYQGLVEEQLLDEDSKTEYDSSNNHASGYGVLEVVYIVICIIIVSIAEINFSPLIMIIMASTLILAAIAISINRKIAKRINVFTQNGVNQIEKWKGLKKYMEDFSLLNEKEIPEIAIWEKFLVYATAFGIADKVIKQLKLIYPNFTELDATNYTIMYMMMNTNFNSTFSSTITTSMTSTLSSGSGSGGGFSGGGGGRTEEVGRWRSDVKTLNNITLMYTFKKV